MRHKAVTTCEEWIHVYRDGSATCFFRIFGNASFRFQLYFSACLLQDEKLSLEPTAFVVTRCVNKRNDSDVCHGDHGQKPC